MKSLFAGLLVAGALLALTAALLGQVQHVGEPTQASVARADEVRMATGIDADVSGNSATSLGNIDPCLSVTSGQTFDLDFFVADVSDLTGWQAMLQYDWSVLTVLEIDSNLFLAANAGSNLFELTPDTLPDRDGLFGVVVVDMGQAPGEDGSGVVVRLTLQAVGSGATSLTLSEVLFMDSNAEPIGDIDGDDYFDGLISEAQIWVDEACPSEPLPTLIPVAPITATPGATPTAVAASPTITETATPAGQPAEDSAPAGDEEGDGFPWAIVAGASAAAIVVAFASGVALVWLRRRSA
jgi:hypothetical protein